MDRNRIIKELENAPKIKRSSIVYQHMKDPALLRLYYKMKMFPILNSPEIIGSSPTDIFIGRYNYPNIQIGPMLPPEFGDTSILAAPEKWRNLSIENIVEMRSKLLRGMYQTKATNVEAGKVEERIRDLALAEKSTITQIDFIKRPFVTIPLNDEVQPFGLSAKFDDFHIDNVASDKRIERSYFDGDAKAGTSILELYERNVPISKIQQALSAGLLGLQRKRKFVPTRWSITAVDDTIAKSNLSEVKDYDVIDSIHAYYNVALDNRWLIFFIPGRWQYESVEAWYPKTIWNESGNDISIYSSYEGYHGRKKYAEIGGCYYAAKLAVTEKLKSMERQAMVIILREVHEGYSMPVGVWNVREHVRETLEKEPTILSSRSELFGYIQSRMEIKNKDWIKNCRMLHDMISQKGINDYLHEASTG